jgi:hypothetical protein
MPIGLIGLSSEVLGDEPGRLFGAGGGGMSAGNQPVMVSEHGDRFPTESDALLFLTA